MLPGVVILGVAGKDDLGEPQLQRRIVEPLDQGPSMLPKRRRERERERVGIYRHVGNTYCSAVTHQTW